MDEDTIDSFLSWQGTISGPHSLDEIRAMLKRGTVHSLYQIQVGDEWCLLRDRLAQIDRKARAAAKEFHPPASPPPPPLRIDDDEPPRLPEPPGVQLFSPADDTPADGGRLATAAFLLSLCFFIPLFNAITQLLALVCGHLALARSDCDRTRSLATTSLWIAYVQVGFLALTLTWLAVTDTPDLHRGYLEMHGQMLGIAVVALLGAGLLMLGIRLIHGERPDFRTCFIGTLLPTAVAAFGWLVVQTLVVGIPPASVRMLGTVGGLGLGMVAIQSVFWSAAIHLPDGQRLGLGGAVLASLFYSLMALLIGALYLMLFTTLAPV